jgi:hypothetical protein
MFTFIRRLFDQFWNKSRTVKNEPLNKVSLIVIILIDIFILVNVFTGLEDIGQWYLAPNLAYPCHAPWQNYQSQTTAGKNLQIIQEAIATDPIDEYNLEQSFRESERGHLGQVSQVCLTYAQYHDKIQTTDNQNLIIKINQTVAQINELEESNNTIRSQYDSTLLEKIAGQGKENSINQTPPEKAKQQLNQNIAKITNLKQEITRLEQQLLAKPESVNFLNFINQKDVWEQLNQSYLNAVFWYPTIQFLFQALFLIPLIVTALWVHSVAVRKGYGLVALISWHLLVIFLIPLILKVFEFLQFGLIFDLIFNFIEAVFGGLIFAISYLYILFIPLVGFGAIKFFQRFVFNPKGQAAKRFQKSSCVKCAKRIRPQDSYCPHCGYYQYMECLTCHALTYQHLPHCKECGASQKLNE